MAINQEARIPVYLNDEQAKQALKNLTAEADKWRKKMHQAMAAGDPKGVKQAEREMKKATAAANKLKRETFDVDRVLQNLSRASVADLRKAMNRLRSEQRLLNRDTKEYKAISKQIGQIKGEFSKINGAITKQRGLMARLTSSVKGLMPAFGLYAIIAGLQRTAQITIDFSKAQSNLAAVLGKSKDEIKDLTKDAIRYGSVTAFTASQVSDLQTEFAKLGFTQDQIRATTRATLDFAAATNAELGPAAKVVGVALKAFNIPFAESERVAAALAVATTKSALSFADYETILSTVGPVANAFNFKLEDTLALTGKLKDAGFDASSAATATRNILLNLADSNGALAQALGRPIKSLDDLVPALGDLQARGIDLNETLQLTDKRSVAAFNAFLTAAGSTLDLRDGLIDVNDQLKDMVETQLDNLAGDITILTSAWQGFILSIEEGDGVIAKFVRGTVQFLTDSLIKLSNIDLIFKRAGKFSTEEVERAYDAMLNLSGRKYKAFQDLVKKENQLTIDQVILRRDAMIQEIRDTGQSRKEATMLWDEFFNRYKEAHQAALAVKNQTAAADVENLANQTASANGLLAVQEQLLEQAKKWPETTEAEIAAKNRRIETIEREIARLKELGTEKQRAEGMVQAKEIEFSETTARQQEIDALKAMEADWLAYQKKMDTEGQKLVEGRIEQWDMEKEGYRALANERIWAAGQVIDALIDMAGRESKLGKALFLLNQARAVGEVIFNMGIANSKAIAASPMTFGQPWVAVNTATAIGSIASIVGQTIGQFTGKKVGGWTGPGSDNQVADFVHANEFVVNAKAARNPTIRPLLDLINQAQIAGTVAQLDFSKMIPSGRQSGGYTTTTGGSTGTLPTAPTPGTFTSNQQQYVTQEMFTKSIDDMIRKISDIKIYAAIETIEKERKNYMTITQTSGL